MRRAPRGNLLLALAITTVCSLPQPARGKEPIDALDYATVGRVVTRFVDGRTVIVIPVAGPLQPKLSEPIRVGRRWRLHLVLEDAKLAIVAPARRGEGVASLSVREDGSDVRITVDVDALGDYGARRSEEGLLLWIDAERKTPVEAVPPSTPTTIPLTGGGAMAMPEVARAQEPPARHERRNWVGWIGLVVLAAGTGAAVRSVRRNGWPDWVADLTPALRGRRSEAEPAGEPTGAASADGKEAEVPFGATPADPRGRSAEIGDAFRLEPEKPASGIAALVATNDNDAQ